ERWVSGVVIRTFAQDRLVEFATAAPRLHVVNALTNEEHPCQALADLLTVQEKLGDLRGKSIAFVGDGYNVAASLVLTATALGMDVRMAAPRGYMLPEPVVSEAAARAQSSGGKLTLVTDPVEAVTGAQAVYTDVWTSMGQERESERRRIDFAGYQLNRALMDHAATGSLVMHDLPAHRGDEITDEMMESEHSIIFDQAENRVWAQAAVVAFLLGATGGLGV
ncbi:MAG: ornithine carbamoyltransferase, partial [Anaerolineaceae bacterium]